MDNKQAINTLQFLWAHSHLSLKYFTLSHEGKLSVNLLFKSNKTNELGEHIHQLIEQMAQDLKAAPELRVFSPFAIILLQKLIHLNPNKIIEHFNLVIPKYFLRKQLSFAKFERTAKENTMHHHDNLIPINHDLKTGLYTAPDDPLAHQHDKEASRIFIATQLERIKGFLSRLFAKIGIHFFENAPYEEHNYLYSDIYANDFAVDPYITKENSHFFV